MRAVGKLSPNTRVKTATGFVGTVADTVLFSGLPPTLSVTGRWTTLNQRCLVQGVASISVSSIGITTPAAAPPGSPGPMTVVQPDTRVTAS
jgi:hypothetical protein